MTATVVPIFRGRRYRCLNCQPAFTTDDLDAFVAHLAAHDHKETPGMSLPRPRANVTLSIIGAPDHINHRRCGGDLGTVQVSFGVGALPGCLTIFATAAELDKWIDGLTAARDAALLAEGVLA